MIYPVNDLPAATALYAKLLGVEPHTSQPYYVGFRVGDQEIGLDPNGHREGPVGYWHVPDINARIKALVDAGGQLSAEPRDVGGGRLIATVKDPTGNVIGLLQP